MRHLTQRFRLVLNRDLFEISRLPRTFAWQSLGLCHCHNKGGHWGMMVVKDSKLWCEERCLVLLQDSNCKAEVCLVSSLVETQNVPPPSLLLHQHSRGCGGLARSTNLSTNIQVAQINHYQLHSCTSLSSHACIVLMENSDRLFSLLNDVSSFFVTCCVTFSHSHGRS